MYVFVSPVHSLYYSESDPQGLNLSVIRFSSLIKSANVMYSARYERRLVEHFLTHAVYTTNATFLVTHCCPRRVRTGELTLSFAQLTIGTFGFSKCGTFDRRDATLLQLTTARFQMLKLQKER